MRRAALGLVLAVSAACAAAAVTLPAGVAELRADDAPADPVAEARRLADEAKEFELVAGDADAEGAERAKARKEALDRLKKARDLLDGWLNAHPADEDRLDKLYCDIASRLYWIKKMSSIGGPDERAGSGTPAPSPGTGPTPATPPGGGSAPGGAAPPAPPPPKTAADVIAEIEEYARRHPGDVPGVYERYQDLLARFPDPSSPQYARAMEQVEALGKRLKDVYRLVHDDDPDALKNADSAQTEKLLAQLLDDLDKGVPEVRARAAKFLGALGSGKAADPLVRTLKKERSGPVFEAAADALARIGGKRVCDRLLKAGSDADLAPAIADILQKILARGGTEGRLAGEALGGYAGAVPAERRGPVFEALAAAGAAGALGLARALPFAPPEEVAGHVEKLAVAGDPRVVYYLAKLMVVNASGAKGDQAQAAREAIEKIGRPGVRYLVPNLDDATVAVWTAEMLHRITGQKLKDDKRKTWEIWFRQNRKALEGR